MRTRVVILDMQPITPAVGGGRQRLLGLYHALGDDIDAVYVGSYDWPGESFRDQQLTPGLREICVPLSDAQHQAAKASSERYGGRIAIDMEFHRQVQLSPDYLSVAMREIEAADVVVFSHPWCFPPLQGALRDGQLVVYDSHNVETLLRYELHDTCHAMHVTIQDVASTEIILCNRADVVMACSHEDRELFNRLLDVPWGKLHVVPNGIFFGRGGDPSPEEKQATREALNLPSGPLAVFLGSNYEPNNDAARFIAGDLARALPATHFVVIGGCCDAVQYRHGNVSLLGLVDESTKKTVLRSADVALNPLCSGSGTSIKMFDFMAAALPVVATGIGARGIESGAGQCVNVVERVDTAAAVAELLANDMKRSAMGAAAREVVRAGYSWERISPALGTLLEKKSRELQLANGRPSFSVLIPSYERPTLLDRLMECLEQQTFRDFEVIVVDQSAAPWPNACRPRSFHLTYIHTDVKGAVRARNTAAHFASGRFIAFTDDDCEPQPTWLEAGSEAFSDPTVVGVEGLIRSDHLGDPDWRPVTNVGFEGIGFMTANLFVRNACFKMLDGFDLRFDRPHFREDTDFGWRLQDLGRVPYVENAEVFHPAQRRDSLRESLDERNTFFEKDALLLSKHPERFRTLFLAEGHYTRSGYWGNFLRGFEKYSVSPPAWLFDYVPAESSARLKALA